MKNIVEIHKKILFWLDQVSTPRYSYLQVDKAINTAVSNMVDKLLGEGMYRGTLNSAEINSESRKILSQIIKTTEVTTGFSTSSNHLSLPFSAIQSYGIRKILGVSLYYSNEWHKCRPATHEKITENFDDNTCDLPTTEYPEMIYYVLYSDHLEFYPDDFIETENETDILVEKIKISYVSDFEDVAIGSFWKSTDTGAVLFSKCIVYSKTITYSGASYNEGDLLGEPVSINPFIFNTMFTAGTVVYNYINPPFPEFTYEEIARTATLILAGTANEQNLKSIFGR